MSSWFLVRHGETAWNVEGRAQGHVDTPLSEVGRRQAELAAARLAGVPFAAAYSSDLPRALEAARLILNGRSTHLCAAPDLRELSYGEWEGVTYREVQERYPAPYVELMSGDVTFAPPGGESVEDLVHRVAALQGRLRKTHCDGENVLVVGHGGSLRALLVTVLDLPVTSFWRFKLDLGSLSIVTLTREGATLDLWNDTGFLEQSGADR